MSRTLWRLFALSAVLVLLASGCGDDDDSPATADTSPSAIVESSGGVDTSPSAIVESSGGVDTSPSAIVELGGGAVINTAECPDEWDNLAGVTDDEIRLGASLPRSGALAGFGTIGDGMQYYFDAIGPVDGRRVVIVSRDDAYVPARTVTNVEEMIDVENLLGFAGILGSPNNLAVRDTLNKNCIPQLLNLTGLPEWGDPVNHPWTTGALMSYETEATIWCQHIADTVGSGATAAILSLDNTAGEAWRVAFNECAPDMDIKVVAEIQHDPQADSVGADVINLASSDADALLVASSGAFCPQAVAAATDLSWEPLILVSNGCQRIALFWEPLGQSASGIRLVNTQKDVSDASLADDEWVQFVRSSLEAQGIDPNAESYALGYQFAEILHHVLLSAAEMEGDINRTNLMRAMWQTSFQSRSALGNALRAMDGANDSYLVEAGRIEELVADSDSIHYRPVSGVISFEGQTGTFNQ